MTKLRFALLLSATAFTGLTTGYSLAIQLEGPTMRDCAMLLPNEGTFEGGIDLEVSGGPDGPEILSVYSGVKGTKLHKGKFRAFNNCLWESAGKKPDRL